MKILPAPSTATPKGSNQSAAHRGLCAVGGNLQHLVVAQSRDEDIARSIHRHALGETQLAAYRSLGTATGRDLHHPLVVGICDEDIARSIHRHAKGVKHESAAHRGLDACEGHGLSLQGWRDRQCDPKRKQDQHHSTDQQSAGGSG